MDRYYLENPGVITPGGSPASPIFSHSTDPAGIRFGTLAKAPKPYYAIQLCCYAEMLAAMAGEPMSEKFGIILGSNDRVEFRVEDFIHYYRCVKASFLAMQDGFAGDIADCPEPIPRAEHGRWSSLASDSQMSRLIDRVLVQVESERIQQRRKLGARIRLVKSRKKFPYDDFLILVHR